MTVNEVRNAVQKELEGPGKNLGYRTMHNKIRQVHKLNVPRRNVLTVMCEVDPAGSENRALAKKAKRVRREVHDTSTELGTLIRWSRKADGLSERHVSPGHLRLY